MMSHDGPLLRTSVLRSPHKRASFHILTAVSYLFVFFADMAELFPLRNLATFASLQLLACDTNFYEQYVAAIPQVGLLGNETGAPVKNGWSNWTLPAPPRDIALSMVCIGYLVLVNGD